MPRLPAALLPLLALALAGCLGAAPPPDAPGGAPQAPSGEGFANVLVTRANGPASEVTVAVNPMDPRNLVGGAKDYTLGTEVGCPEYNVWSGVYWTHDGGATWGNALMPGYPGDANTTLLSHYLCNSDPVLAFGPDGTAYYSGLAYGGAGEADTGLCPMDQEARVCGRSIWTARSEDGGATWQDFVNVAVGDGRNTILDKQWFAVNPEDAQNLVMTWIDFAAPGGVFGGGAFYIAASFDGARSWTPAVPLAEIDAPIHQFAMPAFGPGGQAYVTWRNFGIGVPDAGLPTGTPGSAQVMFTRNAPDTPGFLPARGIAPVVDIAMPDAEFRHSSNPALAVDTSGGANHGTVYVAWPDGAAGNADILLVRSTDQGDTWSAPVRVNQDAGDADQFMSWLAVDEEGGVNVVFYDRSYTPGNALIDVTVARSVDAGATWSQVRVTPESWALPAGCYHQAGFPFLGDYIGIAAAGGHVHPFWADGRTGRCDVFTAAIPYAAFGAAEAAAEPAPALPAAAGEGARRAAAPR